MVINPNWPVIEDAWGPAWNANAGNIPSERYVDITDRAQVSNSVKRGRQYELDQVQSGEYQTTLDSHDGAFDPANTAGPWAGRIKPYQPFRKRAQWPPTPNLLTRFQADGGYGYTAGSIASGLLGVYSEVDANPQIASSATAYSGTGVFQFAIPAATASAARIVYVATNAAAPGITYTMQIQVRNATASTSLQVKPFIGWYGANASAAPTYAYGATVALTGSTTPGWTQVTVTATAPANAYGMVVGVATAATVAAACSVQADGWQLEQGSTATAWTLPGVWYPMYAGFVERWPTQWANDGTYGQVVPTAVDTFALLSQQQLPDPLTGEIGQYKPRFVYRLDDPANAGTFADSTGNLPPVPIGKSKYGTGSLQSGVAVNAVDKVNGIFTGSSGTVVHISNPNPGTNLIGPASFIALHGAGIKGPANPNTFTRTIAFRWTAGALPASRTYVWSAIGAAGGSFLHFVIAADGTPQVWVQGATGIQMAYALTGINVADGNWHYMGFSYDTVTAAAHLRADDHYANFTSVNPALTPTGIIGDSVGAYYDVTVGGGTVYNFVGDVAFVAEYPTALSVNNMYYLWLGWKNAFTGESTGARYTRILKYAGYTGPTSIASGLTQSMGSAIDITGTDALSALQAVVDTESGAHFVAADGTLTFRGRDARYNALTPAYTFGENAAGGEYPYEDIQLDYDSTHLANRANITQTSTGQVFTGKDDQSAADYFPRTFNRSINSTSDLECQDAANYLVSRYRNPMTRVTALKLHPSAYPSLWPVLLSLELGTRVRIIRRPFGAPAITLDVFVENIQWDLDSGSEAWVTLQCSPVDGTPYGVLAAWHTVLSGAVAIGASTIPVKPNEDSTNPLAAQIAAGTQITIEPGTANAETLTVSAVGATSLGWTTGNLITTTAATKAHPANAIICEALPSGTSDPTKWDAVAKLDSFALAY